MKKVLLNFADNILSKNEMKSLKGGYPYSGGGGYCSITITCNSTKKITCSSFSGKCNSSGANEVQGWVQCDNDAKIKC